MNIEIKLKEEISYLKEFNETLKEELMEKNEKYVKLEIVKSK